MAGFLGAVGAALVLSYFAPDAPPAEVAALRRAVAVVCGYVAVPSLAVVVLTGLLLMVAHRPFLDARWVWAKALLGMTVAGTLLVMSWPAIEQAAAIAAAAAAGAPAAAAARGEIAGGARGNARGALAAARRG